MLLWGQSKTKRILGKDLNISRVPNTLHVKRDGVIYFFRKS